MTNKAVSLALGVTMEGQKELLGMWMSENEGARFWLSVFTQLHNRGMQDCFIGCRDGLTGLPEAIETVFPQTRVQLCMVHLVRNSLRYVSSKHRKEVAADRKRHLLCQHRGRGGVSTRTLRGKMGPALSDEESSPGGPNRRMSSPSLLSQATFARSFTRPTRPRP